MASMEHWQTLLACREEVEVNTRVFRSETSCAYATVGFTPVAIDGTSVHGHTTVFIGLGYGLETHNATLHYYEGDMTWRFIGPQNDKTMKTATWHNHLAVTYIRHSEVSYIAAGAAAKRDFDRSFCNVTGMQPGVLSIVMSFYGERPPLIFHDMPPSSGVLGFRYL